MKKWKMAAVIVLCLLVATAVFNKNEVGVYAYTQEEIDAAKAWLEANGYPPTKSGAEQAYQDYLKRQAEEAAAAAAAQTPATTEEQPAETSVETQAEAATVVEPAAEETIVVETTETVTEETTDSGEVAITGSAEEMESTSKAMAEESTADMTEETTAELESSSAAEELGEGFIRIGRYDGIIVVIAIAACAAMGYFTYRYVRNGKKDGE